MKVHYYMPPIIEENPSDRIEELIDKDLKGFKIVRMTEVYRKGDTEITLGLFKDSGKAEAFTEAQTDQNLYPHKTREVLVLTDGSVSYGITLTRTSKIAPAKSSVNPLIANY